MFKMPARHFTTTARVYPNILPFLHTSRRSARWVPPVFALIFLGYGISVYRQSQIERYFARADESQRLDRERRRRTALLLDAYGDKSSLDDIQHAMMIYESQQNEE